ncbi:small heat shock molecular chaperone [Candidatus Scalindua japonica]|uniref:Small heat shock molecular chaperone n=1 Tax=Candidatus Scalindua japonica TaxID=1284222 RepID=A0A286U0P3_9BACT|nr:Hsp20/alpha crystallin family protein [Candidatus Scalindua japonica]GAX61641.1 small heat shock molecular chaperone [Candidatus Scalindua japonica]
MKRELIRLNRLPLFAAFRDDMSTMLDDFLDTKSPGRGWNPDIDIVETDNNIIVKAELPGVDPKEIDISILNDTLTIKGEKKEEKEDSSKSYHRVERSYGRFTRTINLPKHVKRDEIEAKEHKGVLEITLPKMENAETKKITVK